jgi:nucleotide-binding universal stress UspA family protein
MPDASEIGRTRMVFKDILVYVDATKAAPDCLDVATKLAAAHEAHLTALHVSSPAFVMGDFGPGGAAEVIRWQEEQTRQLAARAERLVGDASRRSGHEIEWRRAAGEVLPTVRLHGHYADIVVVSQGGREDEPISIDLLPETVVMGCGRPGLIVPVYGEFPQLGERVLVAWNRTREATRAVHDALPILKRAQTVQILEVNPPSGREPHIAGVDIALHLARHGVKAEVEAATVSDIDIGATILSRAADLGSDLLVMGAYGHSRLREFTLGGVTRHVLQHMTVPVLMSH